MKMYLVEPSSRPREKLIKEGVNKLSDIELLAIMLSSGTKEESVLDLSARLIKEYGFERIFKMSYYELESIKGIKKAKATKLMSAFEIARRAMNKENINCPLQYSKDVYNYIKNDYSLIDYEMLSVIFVNKNCNVILKRQFSNDAVAEVLIPLRQIVNEAMNIKAFGIFLVHNHPSSDLTPSLEDIEATKKLLRILKPLGIHFFDHLILGKNEYFSFGDTNILNI